MNSANENVTILPRDEEGDVRIAGTRLTLPGKQISG
jgi:hypothetical protein